MKAFWFGLFAVLAGPLLAAELAGRVTAVSDGDTLTLLVQEGTSFKQVRVRLAEIDAPESGQPYGQRAKQALSDLAYNKQSRVVVQDIDRYGRTIGRVFVGGVDVSAELVQQGAAWVYRRYAKDPSLYRLEEQAKAAKRGLWGLPETERCPPWDWRRNRCITDPPAACGSKRTCREMTSCEEARFYLTVCGVARLDGNGNGIPCQRLCRN